MSDIFYLDRVYNVLFSANPRTGQHYGNDDDHIALSH